jgi:FkbH-like protein
MTEGWSDALARIHGSPPGGHPPAQYFGLSRQVDEHRDALQPVRLVFLATYTTDLLRSFLKVEGARHGFWIDPHHGAFGQLEQAILDEEWRSEQEGPEVLVLAVRPEDLAPDRIARYYADPGGFDSVAADVLERIDATLGLFRSRSGGAALVANFSVPEPRPLGPFDAGDPDSITHRVHELNRRLLETVASHAGAYVWDYAGLVASVGTESWTDPRLWSLSRTPVAAANQPKLAAHLARTLRGVLRPSAKCLALDLDQTLWGGAIGDDGLRGIQLGDDHPGSAFKRFQRALLGLRDRGVLLAVCSKNDEEVAREAIERHPEMLIRWDDFSAHRINWSAKSENLRSIAEELDIGIDSLVLFDDNPVERAEVRHGAPEVHVVEVPDDPTRYVEALAATAALDSPTVTTEDRKRARYYQGQVARRTAGGAAQSPEEFLESLGMRATIGALDDATSQRIGQLVGKTNQFNLTTKRHTQAELEALATAADSAVYWLRLEDRYGDLGLIAVGVLCVEGDDAVVDSLVLSCRAANRGVEQAMLSHLAAEAGERGCGTLVGLYIESPRNHVVSELYDRLGFSLDASDSGTKRYRLDLRNHTIEPPAHLRIEPREAEPREAGSTT